MKINAKNNTSIAYSPSTGVRAFLQKPVALNKKAGGSFRIMQLT